MRVFGRLALPVTVGYALSRLAKVDVEGSNPFSRSPKAQPSLGFFRFWGTLVPKARSA